VVSFGGQPAYHQIADDLRRNIAEGRLPPGAKLPSESDLIARYNVSRVVVRTAIAQLRNEGLVISHAGKGSFVRSDPPRRRIASDRYQREVQQILHGRTEPPERETSFTRDQRISWEQYRLDKQFGQVPADNQLAVLFEIPPGEPLLKRQFVFYAENQPQQLSTSYLRMALVRDTPVADPANEPWPGGNIAQLATLGKIVTRVEEAVQARMPTLLPPSSPRLAPSAKA